MAKIAVMARHVRFRQSRATSGKFPGNRTERQIRAQERSRDFTALDARSSRHEELDGTRFWNVEERAALLYIVC